MKRPPFLRHGGAVAARIAAQDWSESALGEFSQWPDFLRQTLTLMLDCPHPMYLAWGPDMLSFFNDAYVPLLGELEQKPLGRPLAELWPREWSAISPPVTRAMLGESSFLENHALRTTRNGVEELAYFTSSYSPVRDAGGAVVGMICLSTETTEQRAAQQRLQASYHAMSAEVVARKAERDRNWTLSQDLLGIGRFDGYMRDVNPAWGKLLGYRRDLILTSPFASVIHPEDLPQVEAAMQAMRNGEKLFRLETRVRTITDQYRWIAWSGVPEGALFHVVGRDITVEREALKDLEGAQEALRHAQKMEAVGQLTGGIAHDFNNLLQGIVGSLDLIQKRVAQGRTSELAHFVSGAMASANRASALTHRLLAFSRRQPLDPKAVDVNQLIRTMEELLRRTLGERFHIDMQLHEGLWNTLCDGNQLENAILNLVINARDAMPDGGTLFVATRNVEWEGTVSDGEQGPAPGPYVCIQVADAGCGMSPDVSARAFDPFFTTKPQGQGTGLGLSMIYGFARQSGGHAQICSEVAVGTTVNVYLPRFEGLQEPERAAPESTETQAQEGEVVVVVEDEPVVRRLIVEVLHDLGYQALEASDGPAGLALLNSARRVDLLVTDIGLPGLNGRQVADAARVQRPDLKVLFMTGYAETATVAHGFLGHDMQMMTKPFTIDALAARIRHMLEMQGDGGDLGQGDSRAGGCLGPD